MILFVCHVGYITGSLEINLPKLTNELIKTKEGQALGYTDHAEAYRKLLDIYGIQLFSIFKFEKDNYTLST